MIRILTLTTPDIENGFGCRVTLWFAGCGHHCPGCHNPHTWNYNQGTDLMSDNVLTKIFREVDKEHIHGITLSGGDPLDQNDEALSSLLTFIKEYKIRFPGKDIWVYSGDVYENLIKHPIKREILLWCDVLVDGPFIMEQKKIDLPFRGSTNQRIINLQKSLYSNEIVEIKV